MTKNRVLVLCHDVIGKKMAGPGIRYSNVANELSKVSNVTLAYFSDNTTLNNSVLEINREGEDFKRIFDGHDIIFAQWLSMEMLSYAKAKKISIIFDMYAPVPIEYMASIEFSKTINKQKDAEFEGILEVYKHYLANGDIFVCSNQRQVNFWIGFATSIGLLKPSDFSSNNIANKIIIGPMGIDNKKTNDRSLRLRNKLGLSKNDFVLLWTGGIWDWFDACTIIKAVYLLNNPDIKLVFLGTKHPNSNIDEMNESLRARELSKDLGLTNKNVFFMDGWIDYDKRQEYMLDADVAIYCDKESLETEFSHRTRVLDHIWLGLPTICSKGDYFSDLIEIKRLGIVTDRSDKAFSEAIVRLYSNRKELLSIKNNINSAKKEFYWNNTLSGVVDYVKSYAPQAAASQKTGVLRTTGHNNKLHHRAKRKIIRIARSGLDRLE